MRTTTFSVLTGRHETVADLTAACAAFVAGAGDGLLNVFVPHATAGIAVLELGSGSDDDLLAALQRLLPADDRWRHRHGSPGHGRSHVLPALVAPSLVVPVVAGRLALGTWQRVALVDLNVDNPDRRGAALSPFARRGLSRRARIRRAARATRAGSRWRRIPGADSWRVISGRGPTVTRVRPSQPASATAGQTRGGPTPRRDATAARSAAPAAVAADARTGWPVTRRGDATGGRDGGYRRRASGTRRRASGLAPGAVVQELGYDHDCDEDLRAAVVEATGADLVGADYEDVVDVVLLWWREGDGDLVDNLVDALAPLGRGGVVWLMTPKSGREGHVEPSDISEDAATAGLDADSHGQRRPRLVCGATRRPGVRATVTRSPSRAAGSSSRPEPGADAPFCHNRVGGSGRREHAGRSDPSIVGTPGTARTPRSNARTPTGPHDRRVRTTAGSARPQGPHDRRVRTTEGSARPKGQWSALTTHPSTTSITGPHDLDVGDLAPDFELPDQHRVPVRLSDFRGRRNVLLVFYPWSFSSICTGELCSIRDALPSDDGELQVLAVSVDSVHVQRRFAEQQGLDYPLLVRLLASWRRGAAVRRVRRAGRGRPAGELRAGPRRPGPVAHRARHPGREGRPGVPRGVAGARGRCRRRRDRAIRAAEGGRRAVLPVRAAPERSRQGAERLASRGAVTGRFALVCPDCWPVRTTSSWTGASGAAASTCGAGWARRCAAVRLGRRDRHDAGGARPRPGRRGGPGGDPAPRRRRARRGGGARG